MDTLHKREHQSSFVFRSVDVQQAASSKVNHLGTLPGEGGARSPSSNNKRKAAEVGGITGFAAGKLSLPKKKVPLPFSALIVISFLL